jgi:hypothetical protein
MLLIVVVEFKSAWARYSMTISEILLPLSPKSM